MRIRNPITAPRAQSVRPCPDIDAGLHRGPQSGHNGKPGIRLGGVRSRGLAWPPGRGTARRPLPGRGARSPSTQSGL